MDTDKYFVTSSKSLAVFLYAKDGIIAGTRPYGRARNAKFVFVKTPRLEELADLYMTNSGHHPDLHMNVHAYEQALRDFAWKNKPRAFWAKQK
jgi:hypothetical protein